MTLEQEARAAYLALHPHARRQQPTHPLAVLREHPWDAVVGALLGLVVFFGGLGLVIGVGT